MVWQMVGRKRATDRDNIDTPRLLRRRFNMEFQRNVQIIFIFIVISNRLAAKADNSTVKQINDET